jgi:TolB-like protein/DNA-binding winged helix-turn-helix (wHTH) protein/tetratricopeptide (TPR) repeat protein
MTTSAQRRVRFGSFEFDLGSGELRSGGRKLPLQSQPAQILATLLTSPGQLVTREELRRTIWADDTFVDFDAALNVAVNKVRQVLNDSATAPRFIETIPKRGYRFLADVHPMEATTPPRLDPSVRPPEEVDTPRLPEAVAPVPNAGRSGSGRRAWIAGLSLALILVAWWSGVRVAPSGGSPRSIAVLPFRPLIAEPPDEGLGLGLAEAVIVRLGQLQQLRVPSIHAVQHYAKRDADPLIAGRALGVEAILDGSLQRLNGKLRLSTRLLDVKTGTALWAQQWDLPWTDIFTVQDAMATDVTRALALKLVPEEVASLRQHPTNVDAYDSYLRARALLLRRTTADSVRAAELLEEAVARDPYSAAAHSSLAFAYISGPLFEGVPTSFVELGRRAARRALDLDPTMADAHAVTARILVHFDWDVEGSRREARRALELGPTDPFVLHCTALMAADQGHFAEALDLTDRALAQDPASVMANRDKANVLYLARRYEEAVDQSRRTLELDRYDTTAYFFLARSYEQMNRPQEAVEAYLTPATFREENRETVTALRDAASRGGMKGFWTLRLQHLLKEPDANVFSIAAAYARIGNRDNAIAYLEKHYAARGAYMATLRPNPVWDVLRGDPRFEDLLRRVKPVPLAGLRKGAFP